MVKLALLVSPTILQKSLCSLKQKRVHFGPLTIAMCPLLVFPLILSHGADMASDMARTWC